MKIYRSLQEVPFNGNSVVSIGMFDGVHKAHQQIIKLVVDQAKQRKGRSLLVTFFPHPKEVVSPDKTIELLSTLKEKEQLFENYEVDSLFIIPFTYEFSRLSLQDFYEKYLIKGSGIAHVIEGSNHHLGRDREGGMTEILEMGKNNKFTVEKLDVMEEGASVISSSSIRNHLHEGSIVEANMMLGYEYSFSGTVVRGYGRGKKMGYPTANIKIDEPKKLIPKIGVYAVRFQVHNKWYDGMMSIGHNPTFHEHHERTTEVNIFDFDEDIYDEYVTVRCVERTRDEKKFETVDDLIIAMRQDKLMTQTILKQKQLFS